MGHEEELFKVFIVPERRGRYLSLLESAKSRTKLVNRLPHCHDIDPRYSRLVPVHLQTSEDIHSLLAAEGAPQTCHVVSELSDVDGRDMPLIEALDAVVASGMGTLLSCIAGKLAYYEGEEPGERYILQK